MRRVAGRVDHVQVASIELGGEHSRNKSALQRLPPSVQENKSLAVRADEQVVHVVPVVGQLFAKMRHGGQIGDRYDEIAFAALQIQSPNAGIFRRSLVDKRVLDALIAIARPQSLNAGKIGGHRPLAVGTDRINWFGQRSLRGGFYVEHVTDVAAVLPIVPNYLRLGSRQPLQHATLLPAPSRTGTECNPTVVVLRVDHADVDHVVFYGCFRGPIRECRKTPGLSPHVECRSHLCRSAFRRAS